MDERTFHVQEFLCWDSGGARGEGAAALLLPVRYVHAGKSATQAPADEAVRTEHKDAVAEEGCRNRELMQGGDVQPHR